MSNAFDKAYIFNQTLNNWDVANVEDMSFMFRMARKFNGQISNWNTSNVKNMHSMFAYTNNFCWTREETKTLDTIKRAGCSRVGC